MSNRNYEQRIKNLLDSMTLAEKVGQLNQVGPSVVGAFEIPVEELQKKLLDGEITMDEIAKMLAASKPDYREDDIRAGKIGSMGGVAKRETAMQLQRIAVEESRLGIPLIFGYDVIHGFRTGTPIPLAESCAWEPELWRKTARMAAKEAAYAGVNMTFAPMVDVSRDARWGRVAESAGEDTLLNAHYGAAKVRGFQGEDPTAPDSIAACAKHFAAYGFAEGGRDYNRVEMSEQQLREDVLPPFKACIDAGVLAVMPSFNDINGVPSSVNTWLLRDILRSEWGFKGTTVSDANAIEECIAHGVCADKTDAAKAAIEAGMDIDMNSCSFADNLEELVSNGSIDIRILDEAVKNVLRVKFELGLFENPYGVLDEDKQPFLKPEYRALAREAAQKSIVLLKNENILPLAKDKRIGVVGELAANASEMTGTWALSTLGEDCVSLVDGLSQRKADYVYYENAEQAISDDIDTVLLCVGEGKDESGEAASKARIELSEEQLSDFRKLKAAGKKIVVILFNGRPLAIPELKENADAIIEAWHLGVEAGNALADIIYGDVMPTGKLTVSFPNASGECPCYYSKRNTGRPAGGFKFTSKYLDIPSKPVYPFGYGLSYTEYEYSDISVERTAGSFKVSAVVRNVGAVAGVETVQCYFSDPVARRTRPIKKLVSYAKIQLAPGEAKRVAFEIPFAQLGYYDEKMRYIIEQGKFIFHIGKNSEDVISAEAVL